MTWYAVQVRPEDAARDAVAAWLVKHTGHAVEERTDGTLISYALDLPSAEALGRDLRAAHGEGLTSSHHEIPVTDWSTAWRSGLGPRRVGPITIVPTWLEYAPGADELVVRIDPEMAFGSGEHGSTRAALALVVRHLRPGDRVLDFGSGSGILSIAAAKLGAARAIGIEVDDDALPVSVANAERNGVSDRVTFFHGDAADLAPLLRPANLVVSNILRLVNVALLPEVHAVLSPGGIAIFSGMEEREADDFRHALGDAGFEVRSETIDNGWWAVAAGQG
jgi:ribosomal protein L11 methyltransferase